MILVCKDSENSNSVEVIVITGERMEYTIVQQFNVSLGRFMVICSILVRCLPVSYLNVR